MLNSARNCFSNGLWKLSFIGILMLGFAVASLAPYRSIIGIERLGLSEIEFALYTTISAIATIFVSIAIGIFTDQTGRYKDVLIASLLIGSIGNSMLFVWQTKPVFIITFIVFFPIAATAISQLFTLAKLAVNSSDGIDGDFSAAVIRAAFAGSYAITPPIWAILILQGVDLFTIFGATAVVNLIMIVIIYLKWPQQNDEIDQPKVRAEFGQAIAELSSARLFIRLTLISIIGSLTSLNSTLVGLIILNDLGGTEIDVGWFAGFVALCEIPIMILSTSALKFVTKPVLILIGVTLFGVYLGAFQFLSSTDYLWFLIIPASLGGGIFIPLVIGYIQELMDDKPGTGGALISITNIAGHIVTAIIFGVCTLLLSYSMTAFIGAMIAIFSGITLVIIDKGGVFNPMRGAPDY